MNQVNLKIICGLGNPGSRYENTRHNIGWMVADALAERYSLNFSMKHGLYHIAKGEISDEQAILIKPVGFMNNSGRPVCEILAKTGISPYNLIVVHDDLDLDAGRIKIKKGGGHGGHNGIRSICSSLGTPDFVRIRIGIGRDAGLDPADYVLSPFRKSEAPLVEAAIDNAVNAVLAVMHDLSAAMNSINS